VAFYRLCQEGLNNIAKHAEAAHVEIHLQYHADAVTVELNIRDDGRGFDPEHIPAGHFGLSMMRERAEDVGAMLSVVSRPGRGTELTVRWPKTPEQGRK
jgi:two-component system sensor histidine kinase DegS